MTMIWYDTNSLTVKILQVKHGLDRWVTYRSPQAGRGVVQVREGPQPTPPKPIYEILKVSAVIQVISDSMDGQDYFVIGVEDPKFWDQVKADVQGVVLQELPREDNDAGTETDPA